jgi:hypothetical protein
MLLAVFTDQDRQVIERSLRQLRLSSTRSTTRRDTKKRRTTVPIFNWPIGHVLVHDPDRGLLPSPPLINHLDTPLATNMSWRGLARSSRRSNSKPSERRKKSD